MQPVIPTRQSSLVAKLRALTKSNVFALLAHVILILTMQTIAQLSLNATSCVHLARAVVVRTSVQVYKKYIAAHRDQFKAES
eukprot:11570-Heterococcus_DN1.PRE.1